MKSIIFSLLLLCAATSAFAQGHTLQLDNGPGNVGIISGSGLPAGITIFTLPPTGGTLVTSSSIFPNQAGHAGKFLMTNGTTVSWEVVPGSWSLTGNAGTTAGTNFLGTTDDEPFQIHIDNANSTATNGRGRVMRYEPNATSANIIGGFKSNSVSAGVTGATISGGGSNGSTNSIASNSGTIGGGRGNSIGASSINATISGGVSNQVTASAGNGTIAGGLGNVIVSGDHTTISGGFNNQILTGAFGSTLSGGTNNRIGSHTSVVGGGNANTIGTSSQFSTIAGGHNNRIDNSSFESFIGGGTTDTINPTSPYSTIGGGTLNRIRSSSSRSVISGGYDNLIEASSSCAVILGGRGLTLAGNGALGFLGNAAGTNNMSVNSANTAVLGNVDLWLANNDNSPSNLVFFEAYNATGAFPNTANRINIASPAVIGADYTLTLPVDDGAANEVLTTDGNGVLSWTSSSGLAYWTEAENTAAPNATIPVASLTPTTGGNVDVAIVPKGTGAFLADIPDNGVAGGNKRGENAVDLQTERNSQTQVASGLNSVLSGGSRNTSSDIYTTVSGGFMNTAMVDYATVGGGRQNLAQGIYAVVSGGSGNQATFQSTVIAGGLDNTASGSYAIVNGGLENVAAGSYTAILGGRGLTLDASADHSFGFLGNNAGGTPLHNMIISEPEIAVFGNVDLWLANNDNTQSKLVFFEANNTDGAYPNTANRINIQSPTSISADYTLTLPVDDGTANQVLTTNGSGVLSWSTVSGGSTDVYDYQANDVTVSDNTTLQATDISIALDASSVYAIEGTLSFNTNNTNSADIKWRLGYSGTANRMRVVTRAQGDATSNDYIQTITTDVTYNVSAGDEVGVLFHGFISTNTAGNLTVTVANDGASGGTDVTILFSGSWVKVKKLN